MKESILYDVLRTLMIVTREGCCDTFQTVQMNKASLSTSCICGYVPTVVDYARARDECTALNASMHSPSQWVSPIS